MPLGIHIELSPPLQIIVMVITVIIFYLVIKIRKQPFSWKSYLIQLSFVYYLIKLISITLFPVYIALTDVGNIIHVSSHNSFIPFRSILNAIRIGEGFRQNVGNIVMMFPLGFYIPLLRKRFVSFRDALFTGILVSASIEGLQGVENVIFGGMDTRTVDIDDVILNTIGTLLGYGFIRLMYIFVELFRPKTYIHKKLNNGN